MSSEPEDAPVEYLSEEFYKKLSAFTTLNNELLKLRADSKGTDESTERSTSVERVSEKLEAAASKVLKDELASLEKWIDLEQKSLQE